MRDMTKLVPISVAVLFLASCKSLVVDKVVIKSPNWLPGVDLYLDVEEDMIDDIAALNPDTNDKDVPVHPRCHCQILRKQSTKPEPAGPEPLRRTGASHSKPDQRFHER